MDWLRQISQQLTDIHDALTHINRELVRSRPPQPGRPARLSISVGPITKQGEGTVQLHDDEQVTFAVSAVDSKGFPTSDTFTAVTSDETVITITDDDADAKTFLAVAGVPGSAVVTITETDGPLTVTEAFDVVTGDAVTIKVEEGTPEKQPVV